MSLLDVIERYRTGAITVHRALVGASVDGQYTPAAPVDILTDPIRTSVQPITGDQLKDLPEGQRTEDSWFVWTTTPLLARSDVNDPDVLEGAAGGLPLGQWRVIKIEGPFRLLSGHYRATVSKVNIQ